jgi:RNA polymerase sigma factor (TIGR02999 family)
MRQRLITGSTSGPSARRGFRSRDVSHRDMLGRMSDVTQILSAAAGGDSRAAAELLPLVYDELRKLAAARLAAEKPGQTLQATALVHEAYVRLVGPGDSPKWDGQRHFFAAAAEAMRRILVEYARRKKCLKWGGELRRVDLAEVADEEERLCEVLSVNEALDRLAREDAVKAQLVQLRYFAGLSIQEAADTLNISRSTADRYWAYAKAWLYRSLSDGATASD